MRRLLPKAWRRRLVRWTRRPRVGGVDWGQMRRTEPFSRVWGGDRGLPIDRYYIEGFLAANAERIRGIVLEVGGDDYTRRFGGSKVDRCEVLSSDVDGDLVRWTTDLAQAPEIPDNRFDCIVLTQTLQFIPDVGAALDTLHRILAPDGWLLLTVPGISQTTEFDSRRWGDCWRFTPGAVEWLLKVRFQRGGYEIGTAGNLLAATAFLYGLATDELTSDELDRNDVHYPLIVTATARKQSGSVA